MQTILGSGGAIGITEFPEMIYQYEQDYIFDSTKYEKRFGITATTPKEGLRMLIESMKTQNGSR